RPEDVVRKYTQELHANDIMLLAYYIATVNVEMTFHDMAQATDYTPFNGIVFADSFEAQEHRAAPRLGGEFLEANNERMTSQNRKDIQVIVGNPPWSSGQGSANDDNANRLYPTLRQRISGTYAQQFNTQNRNSLYDTYIQAIRMASDRIQESQNGGVVAFVTNGGFIDGDAAAGLRSVLIREFHKVYCLNLRGEARGSGDVRRREAGNVFGGGSRTRVAILLLVRKPGKVEGQGEIFYHDIGDYLTRERKLEILDESRKSSVDWQAITPDQHGDWINQRDPGFSNLVPLYGEDGSVFILNSPGIKTHRDTWVYGFSSANVTSNTRRMMESYNQQIPVSNPIRDAKEFSWTRKTLRMAAEGIQLDYQSERLMVGEYRPYVKQAVYFHRSVNEEIYQQERIFPGPNAENIGISVSHKDRNKLLSCLMTNMLPDVQLTFNGQYLPRWIYERSPLGDGYDRVSNINPVISGNVRMHYATDDITEDDLFHYSYAMLHHSGYRSKYAANLSKEAARIPLVATLSDFRAFVDAGEVLSDLHRNYESVEPYPLEEVLTGQSDMEIIYRVSKKMKHPGKRGAEDESAIVYNDYITLKGIPEKAYRYTVGQYSALRWLMERYCPKTDWASGIENDPNDWGAERGDPRYILDLIKRIVTVSVKTVDIVDGLPDLPE
ncbi:MAG: damage-inducible protein, partial [Dehalococcoidia bacterium]|nr:damage-inducible protein [Dehalococcoidia bacterium]